MQIDMSPIKNEWLVNALCEALVAKSSGLAEWSRKKELEYETQIHDLVDGRSPADIDETKLEAACLRLERQQASTQDFMDATKLLCFETGVKVPSKSSSAAVERAKALLRK